MPALPSSSHLARLLPLAAGVLLLTGCANADNPTTEELEAMIAPSSSASVSPEPADETLRFNAETMSCEPRKNSAAPGAWETAAPRTEVSEAPANLRLRDAEGTGERLLTALVVAPSGDTYRAQTQTTGTDWAEVAFPADFESAPETPASGVYTVVWTAEEEAFVSCDGFQVA
ncbi:copper resistance protein CopC [Marinactinospora thermotolerans]|nr:copper resistance protein CopC [Marinactinospora thermotolerans]